MKRHHRPRDLAPEISPVAWALLTDGPLPDVSSGWERFGLERFGGETLPDGTPTLLAMWRECGPEIVEAWASEHPGTRPRCWWAWSAPRVDPDRELSQRDLHGEENALPRLRLGGIGTPGLLAGRRFGIPTSWTSRWDVAYYNGRARNIYGEPIGDGYRDGAFHEVAPDPDDPPTFESQAAYLERLDLLARGERKRLKASDFAPEAIDVRGYLAEEAARSEADRQRRIALGSWQGEPAGWDPETGPFIARPVRVTDSR